MAQSLNMNVRHQSYYGFTIIKSFLGFSITKHGSTDEHLIYHDDGDTRMQILQYVADNKDETINLKLKEQYYKGFYIWNEGVGYGVGKNGTSDHKLISHSQDTIGDIKKYINDCLTR